MLKTISSRKTYNYILTPLDLKESFDKDLHLVSINDFRDNIVSEKQLKYANSVTFMVDDEFISIGN
jgi:protein associated with RNAse G/E